MAAAPSCSTSPTTRRGPATVAAEEGPRVEKMRADPRAALTTMAPGGDRARTAAVAPEQVAILRSLGYVAGSGGAGELDQPGLPDPRDRVHLYERLQASCGPQTFPSIERAASRGHPGQDPDNPFAHQTVASLAYRAGRLGEAARVFARARARSRSSRRPSELRQAAARHGPSRRLGEGAAAGAASRPTPTTPARARASPRRWSCSARRRTRRRSWTSSRPRSRRTLMC